MLDLQKTYFIADIASNHNGSLSLAKDLIVEAAKAGADAAKFQHFHAATIAHRDDLNYYGDGTSHMADWREKPYDVYLHHEIPIRWNPILAETCHNNGISFITTPYSLQLVDEVAHYVDAWKIGSGDITYHDLIDHIVAQDDYKHIILSTGASTPDEVCAASRRIPPKRLILLQCNTNYTGDTRNNAYINLKWLNTLGWTTYGLSDHTMTDTTVLGAVALGAKVIEKHFTLQTQNRLIGPDQHFSIKPKPWKQMVNRVRELEASLGDGVKMIESNEVETRILQRRAVRARNDIAKGCLVQELDLVYLRPCPLGSLPPWADREILGKELIHCKQAGETIVPEDVK